MQRTRRKGYLARMAALSCVAVLGILALSTAAYGQAGTQYVPATSPVPAPAGTTATGGNTGGGGGGGDGGGSQGAGAGGTVAEETGQASGGELPFTGYPLTPIVVIVAFLLAGGIAVRFAVPALDRRRGAA